MHGRMYLLSVVALLGWCGSTHAAGAASGYFRMGDVRLDVRHAIAVVDEESESGEGDNTFVFLSAAPLDAAKVAAAFDPMDAVREQDPEGGYIRVCVDAEGGDCGLFFSPEGFNSGGYGESSLEHNDARRVAGRFVLAEPEDFMGEAYQFDLRFDTAITPLPGTPLPPGGGDLARPTTPISPHWRKATSPPCARWRAKTVDGGIRRMMRSRPRKRSSRPATASPCRRRSFVAACTEARRCCGCGASTATTFRAPAACGW